MFITQNNFNGGIVTRWIDTRSDLSRFRNSLRECLNFICTPYGGLRRRMGTEFVAQAGGKCRLLAFQLGSLEGYILEFGDRYLRFYSDGVRVGTLQRTTPWSVDEIFSLQLVKINAVMFLTHPNHAPQRLQFKGGDNWTLGPMDFDYPAFADAPLDGRTIAAVSGGTVIATESVTLDYNGNPAVPQRTASITSNGPWRVDIASLVFTAASTKFLTLQKSTDGGTNWIDIESFQSPGSYTGSATGLLRLSSLECEVDAELGADNSVEELAKGTPSRLLRPSRPSSLQGMWVWSLS